jgi:NAD(P)-dependent dehydrogenase (short-subunit alcohol dehydrogenase family)
MDVSDPLAVEDAVGRIEGDVGPIYGAVINAAIAIFGSTLETTDKDWRSVLATNLDGAFYCARAFGRRMRGRGGSIVFISSIAARTSGAPAAFAGYGVSKAGISHLAEMLGVEWAREGIRVNAIEPGYTETQAIAHLRREAPHVAETLLDSIPIHRFLQPPELAQIIGFLLSDLSSAMTGSVLVADGGFSAK